MRFKILGFNIPVIYQKDLIREHSKRGHYDPFKGQIKICRDLNKQAQLECIIHEIFEVIETELVLELKHNEQLSKLATAWFQVLKDNKKIFERLLKCS